ncbi:hypothetical protein SHJG_2201 [Streptomyces hygroscopicus subsp. jinggangensis 5008]|nr:hypothetical protein SHJG_2201 [Streptomyces hygroscopicus subsp. jinggangensis 5008]AGF61632.1 hypothetical protein SHJGH_1966 [Streptomyces hygroscopicus subsp. jinggangensis TL01]
MLHDTTIGRIHHYGIRGNPGLGGGGAARRPVAVLASNRTVSRPGRPRAAPRRRRTAAGVRRRGPARRGGGARGLRARPDREPAPPGPPDDALLRTAPSGRLDCADTARARARGRGPSPNRHGSSWRSSITSARSGAPRSATRRAGWSRGPWPPRTPHPAHPARLERMVLVNSLGRMTYSGGRGLPMGRPPPWCRSGCSWPPPSTPLRAGSPARGDPGARPRFRRHPARGRPGALRRDAGLRRPGPGGGGRRTEPDGARPPRRPAAGAADAPAGRACPDAVVRVLDAGREPPVEQPAELIGGDGLVSDREAVAGRTATAA